MKKILLLIFCLYFLTPFTASGGELVVYQKGEDLIRGFLPESWIIMAEDEVSSFINNKEQLASEKMKTLAGYRFNGSADASAMLFVFYSQPDERVSWEQRQKMYSWFKGDAGLTSGIFPDNMQSVTLENLEYIQDKDTVLFESKVKIDGTELQGVNGIVFLRTGYLDIAGYVSGGDGAQLQDFYEFIKTLYVSPGLQYSSEDTLVISRRWILDHWQQVLGGMIFVLVYGVTFLKNKGRDRVMGKV